MKKIYTSILPYALLVLVLALCSCTKDKTDNLSADGGKYSRQLVLNVMQPITRAMATEEQVTRLDILLFKEGKFEKVVRNVTSFGNVDGKTAVTVAVDTEGMRDIYTVANAQNDTWLDRFVPGITSVDELMNIETEVLIKMANPPLIMCGITWEVSFGEFSTNAPCELYRIVARIDVKNNADNFQIISARLINSKKTSVIFSGAEPTSSAVGDFEDVAAVNGGVQLYSYENYDTNPQTATTIEITGEADGKPLTYKVDFKVDGKQVAIQRNYLYTVNVTNVAEVSAQVTITVKEWLPGDGIDHTILGDVPVTTIGMDSRVGSVNMVDSTLSIRAVGGDLRLQVKANAECGIELSSDWMQLAPQTRSASFIESEFSVTAAPSSETTERTGTITIYNKLNPELKNTFIVKQELGDDGKDKYLVIAVAGQSNAVGYDESAVFPNGIHAPSDQAYELSYGRKGANLEIVKLNWCADNLQDMTTMKNVNGIYGMKSIQLPLAKELVKRIPAGYKLLFVNVAYGSSTFIKPQGTSMAYDAAAMRPTNLSQPLMWGVGRPYTRTLIDRVKHSLDLNLKNKFLGVIWCQGEGDANYSDEHYSAFTAMTEDIFKQLNGDGYGARCPRGVADKNLWYNFSSTSHWSNWYLQTNASPIFGGYKVWNPDTFIHVPFNTHTNLVGGNGATSSTRAAHFGNDTYTTVIAPAIAECMDENGGLFNGKSPKGNRFNDNITSVYAANYGGELSDADVQQSLVLYMPFTSSEIEKITGNQGVMRSGTLMVDAKDLTDINGNPRSRKAIVFSTKSKLIISNTNVSNSYSFAFMLRRTGLLGADIQTVLSNNGNASMPFVGFRSYGTNQRTSNMTEFVCEPLHTGQKAKAVPGVLLEADNVSSLTQWIHYVVTYDHTTKQCIIYMNGQEVQRATISNTAALSLSRFVIGNSSTTFPGFEGQFAEFFIWSKVITPATASKIFLMSYYGYTK